MLRMEPQPDIGRDADIPRRPVQRRRGFGVADVVRQEGGVASLLHHRESDGGRLHHHRWGIAFEDIDDLVEIRVRDVALKL